MTAPPVICQHCGLPNQVAVRVSIHGMYDMHLFHAVGGGTVDEVIANWEKHNASPQPAMVDGQLVDDMGKSWLCPVIVLDANNEEVRRVGNGIWPERGDHKRYDGERSAFRAALLADPDIPRLLGAR